MDSQEPQNNRSLKEKAADGWKLLKQLVRDWALDIYGNKKKLLILGVAAILCIFAFLRGLVLMLF